MSNGEDLQLEDLRPGLMVRHREHAWLTTGRCIDVNSLGFVTVQWPIHGQRDHGFRFLATVDETNEEQP